MAKVTIDFDTEDKMSVLDAYMIAGEMMHKAFPKWFMKGGESMDNNLEREGMKATLHELRKEVDAVMQKVNDLRKTPVNQLAGRNISIVFTHLEDAKMRLGKCLEDIGSELPKEFQDKAE